MGDNFIETKLDNLHGHGVLFEFHVHDLVGKFLWHTVKDYEINCRVLPTSWLLEMQLKQVPVTGDVSIPIILKRNDTVSRPVNAYIAVKFTDTNNSRIFGGLTCFGKIDAMPGEEICENILGFIPPEKRSLFNEDLLVTVTISIRSCHLDSITNPATIVSTDRKKLCSMM